jgi:hypothetical protein
MGCGSSTPVYLSDIVAQVNAKNGQETASVIVKKTAPFEFQDEEMICSDLLFKEVAPTAVLFKQVPCAVAVV